MAESANLRRVLRIRSDPEELAELRHAVRAFLETSGLPEERREPLVLAVNEAFANIFRHAYQDDPTGEVEVEMEGSPEGVEIRIRDWGRPPRPGSLKPRDLDQVRPGGLGLHFIRTACDEVRWGRCSGDGNELRLVLHAEERDEE